ncbi:MAG: HAD family hydrolase, partial [Eubacteriales bacterium]|nr:HAD family hydrolase [Eubacteriales bacterium]
ILFFDLDGTLLESASDVIPESAARILERVRGDYLICIATGRDMDADYSRKYVAMVNPDAIIHSNGTKVDAGGERLYDHQVDRELLRRLYDYAKSEGFCLGFSNENGCYYTEPEIKRQSDITWRGFCDRTFLPFEEAFTKDIPVCALSFAGDIARIKPLVEERFPEITLFAFNNGVGADVVEKEYSKAEGMKRVCEYYGIPMECTYAFGDSANDVPMLRAAAVGIAMGNADKHAIDAADHVTTDINEDGIKNAIERYVLCERN